MLVTEEMEKVTLTADLRGISTGWICAAEGESLDGKGVVR